MARLTTVTAFLIASVTLSTSAAAQVLTFARDDYASNLGARAIVSADFNRDGWLDVAHANLDRNSVTILLNQRGSGLVRAFEVAVGAGPFGLAAGDFNRDGIPDLAVANADGNSISILLGRGNGSFARTDVTAASQNPRGIATADVNNDGRPDLIYTGFATGAVQVLIGNGAGAFAKGFTATAAGSQPQGVTTADFNHDGVLDIAVACASATGLRVLYGSSTGSFTARTIAGHANLNVIAAGDMNGDGWLDVAAASTGSSDVAVYLGGASGLAFARAYVVGGSPRGIAFADVNGDGRLDVVTANRLSSTVSVLAGDRAHPGTFLVHREFAAARGSRALVAGDFNGDGRLDVATGNEYTAGVTVLSNVTGFTRAAFSFDALTIPAHSPLGQPPASNGRFPSNPPRLEVADFNRDGRIDFAATGGPADDPASVAVMLRDGPTVTLGGPHPLNGFLVDDFNADGNADVLYYSSDSASPEEAARFLTYLGDGRGHFAAAPVTVEPHYLGSCASGDLNRDGRPDLVCDYLVLLGNGNGTFRAGVAFTDSGGGGTFPARILADVNRDGRLDLVDGGGVYLGDGNGHLVFAQTFDAGAIGDRVLGVADLNHDGYLDLVMEFGPTDVLLVYGSAGGFVGYEIQGTLEGFGAIAFADLDADGTLDMVLNGSTDTEGSGILQVLFGSKTGTFTQSDFALTLGAITVADVNGDGLPDVAAFDSAAVQVLVNERNGTNHPPVVPDYSITSGNPCVTLDAKASDPDQHALTVEWFDSSGASIRTGVGVLLDLDVCVGSAGTYTFRRTATDGRGGAASGTVAFTYVVTLKEIVLYAAADAVAMAGNWSRVADATAAGGFRAHDANGGAPKVPQPSPAPANTITIPFVADPNLTYKLWVRLKADANSWANDSVWIQFSGASAAPYTPARRPDCW